MPQELEVTPWVPRRMLVVGSCLAGWMRQQLMDQFNTTVDYVLTNAPVELPEPPAPAAEYDIQIIVMSLRNAMLGDYRWAAALRGGTSPGYFEEVSDRVRAMLHAFCKWSRPPYHVPTLVAGFIVPQLQATGRHQPRFDLTNLSHFVERLNIVVETESATLGARYLDLDAIAATYGKRYISDEVSSLFVHGSVLSDFNYERDRERIEGPRRLTALYPGLSTPFTTLVGREIEAMARTWRRQDEVKMVVWDLDDTLWRGIAAEGTGLSTFEGWPMGLYDAVHALHFRGILQAILSKNDGDFIRGQWRRLTEGRIPFDIFAATRISFDSKPAGMSGLLADVGLTARSVVFVDDNPAERAAMQAAFPEMRILGSNHLALKRILLSAPETQVAVRTVETAERTTMVRAQIEREEARRVMSYDEFLSSLKVEVVITQLSALDAIAVQRALELANKTNQFNTTGARYTTAQFMEAVTRGVVYTGTVSDRFTQYGLVAVVLLDQARIAHYIMSCRVLGLGVEQTVIAAMHRRLVTDGVSAVTAILVARDANRACHGVWASCGYAHLNDQDGVQTWGRELDDAGLRGPQHVTLTLA